MADALCGLLAARSFIIDLLQSEERILEGSEPPLITTRSAQSLRCVRPAQPAKFPPTYCSGPRLPVFFRRQKGTQQLELQTQRELMRAALRGFGQNTYFSNSAKEMAEQRALMLIFARILSLRIPA